MSFLNLSTAGALVVALLTLGAVLVLFFLKLRHRRVIVGSALLWDRVLNDQKSNALFEKLRRWLSLVLALAIALLIALAAGRPYLTSTGDPLQPLIVVLDTSESMSATTTSGQTRWERAVAEAERIVVAGRSPAGVMVADTSGRVRTPILESTAETLEAIDRMGPFPGPTRFPRLPRGHARPYFITDGVRTPNNVPAGATNISVFEEADNVAITSFRVEVDPTSPSGYSAFLEVTNYSRTPKDVAIVVAGVAGQRVVRGVQLAPAGSWNEVMDLGAFRGGGVQARIQTEDDRFPADDVAFSYLPTRGEVNVTLVTPETDGYLEALLRLTPEVELTVTAPSAFEESVSTDVYVFDGAAPGQAPGRPSLVFGVPQTNWLPEPQGVDAQIRISSWDDDHPVMRFVPSYDLGIDEAFIVDPDGRNVVASSGSTPLILIDDGDGNQKTVLVTFSLASSDFAFHLGFPIFVENVLAWFSGETLAETRQLGEIELPLGTTAVTRLDGTPLDLATRSGQTVVELDEPDLLTAIVDGRRTRVAANMTDPERSDINGTSLTGAEDVQADVPRAGGELWFYMLLGATLLVATEWWTYHRRITV